MNDSLSTSNCFTEKDNEPIGVITLANGERKTISPMQDFFINYMFEDSEYWEVLKALVNIFLEWYANEICSHTKITVIKDDIKVETQYAYFTGMSKQKSQDLKITGVDVKFVEFQIKAKPEIPIRTRAQHYLGLSLATSKGDAVNQIWLLAEDIPELVSDVGVSNYVLIDEVKHGEYPDTSSIMFLSLQTLSALTNTVGELASFLLDWAYNPTDTTVSWIRNRFTNKFKVLKQDREATELLITRESELREAKAEGWAEGKAEGRAEGKAEVVKNMSRKGFTLEMITMVTSLTLDEVMEILSLS